MPRRPLIAAAAAAALALAAGCGGDDVQAGCVELDDASARVEADAPGATGGQLVRTRQRVCERARRAGVALDVHVRDDGLTVRSRERDADAMRALLARARLAIVDWEPNVHGDPDEPRSGLRDAVAAARRARPRAEASDVPPRGREPAALALAGVEPGDERALRRVHDRRNDVASPARWLLDERGRPVGGPVERDAPTPRGGEALDVPRGVRVVAAEGGWFALEDDAALTGAALDDPRAERDPTSGEPIVAAGLSPDGRRRFSALTRRVAARGARAPNGDREFQRVAILLDERVVALLAVNHEANPRGLDGETGIQLGTGGSLAEARGVAAALALGPLPVALVLR